MALLREVLLGPSYFYHRRLIEQSKDWSPEEIRKYQQARLHRLTQRYGNKITQREDYSCHLRQYTHWDVPLLNHTVRTGGTSGQPLRFKADTFARRQKERAYLFDTWAQVGYRPHALRVVYRGNVYRDLLHFDRLENAWIVSPNATIESQFSSLRLWVRMLPPFFLHVYPSSLYTFIDLVGEGLFRTLPVLGVLAGSEVFPPDQQRQFEREFGVAIAHWYGHSEYAVFAYCCRRCGGFHFCPTYGHMELIPSDTEDCLRIVTSSFNWIGTQFVRYDAGDLAVGLGGTCSADNFPRTSAIIGRGQETFVDSAGQVRALGAYIFGIHGRFWDQIRDLQFIQDAVGSLCVRIVPARDAEKDLIEQTLEGRIPMARLKFEYVPAIERSPSGKRRYFISGMQAASSDLLQGNLNVEAPHRKARQRGVLAVTSLALVVAIAALSFLLIAAVRGGNHPIDRTHRVRSSIVDLRVSSRHSVVSFISDGNQWLAAEIAQLGSQRAAWRGVAGTADLWRV